MDFQALSKDAKVHIEKGASHFDQQVDAAKDAVHDCLKSLRRSRAAVRLMKARRNGKSATLPEGMV